MTGRVDHDLLDHLARQLGDRLARHPAGLPAGGVPAGGGRPGGGQPGGQPEGSLSTAELRDLLLAHAVALLSGPGGLASVLRTGTLPRPAASVSLPLDIGTATDTIPPHMRRAVIARDRHCGAPGCYQPPDACDVHHIVPRSRGGPTSLTSLILLCSWASPLRQGFLRIRTGIICSGTTGSARHPVTAQTTVRPLYKLGCRTRVGRNASLR